MTQITSALIQELRTKTGAGMMKCKEALLETNGDMEAAVDWLRKKGLAAASKKAGRIAAEGLVGLLTDGSNGALVEVNAETDFVARNDQFQGYVKNVTALALSHKKDLESLSDLPYGHGTNRTVSEELTNMIAVIGENMALRRLGTMGVSPGVVVGYMHSAIQEGLGKLGVMVALESSGSKAELETLGKQIAMHIAATNPQSVSVEELDPALLDRERDIITDQARQSGKPEEFIGKMVEGRLRKFYEESVLLEQTFVIDGESKIKDVIKKAEAKMGTSIKIDGFLRFALGEGIEKKEDNFVEEVASLSR
ncbi:MAG: elongation factor Ts [Alphaproteobacteria bacterium]|nr:elongation factor Ts [Alphaproteobacteria bacterium]